MFLLRQLGVSSSHPDRSRLRQSLASLKEQYERLQQEHNRHREQHDAETEALRKEVDLLANERTTAVEVHQKNVLQVEQEHVEQIRRLRGEKEELDEDKHQLQLVRSISVFATRAADESLSP